MDTEGGIKLPYMHWQKISHPKFGLYVFQKDESGEQILSEYNFLMPNYLPFRLKATDGKKDTDKYLVNQINNGGIPNGTLYGFTINNIDYTYANGKYADATNKPYANEYKLAERNNEFKLIIQAATNSCLYYLAARKVVNLSSPSLNVQGLTSQNVCNTGGIPIISASNTGQDNDVILLADCNVVNYFDKIHFSIQTETYGQRLVRHLNLNIQTNAAQVKFNDALNAIPTDKYDYINVGAKANNDPIFKDLSLKELNNKLAYLEASSGVQLYIKFVETSCSFNDVEGKAFTKRIFDQSNISKTKGIYVLIVRNRKSNGTLYDWKTYFAFGTDIDNAIKIEATASLTLALTANFNDYAKKIIKFYREVPKKQLQYIYTISKVSQAEYDNAVLTKDPITKNLRFKLNEISNAKGNALQPLYKIYDETTGMSETLALDVQNDLKEEYVVELSLDVAKKIAVQKARWRIGQKTRKIQTDELEFTDATPKLLKCRFSLNQNCTEFYIETSVLIVSVVAIPFGEVAMAVADTGTIIYYASTGQTDMAMIMLGGYALGPILAGTIKSFSQVGAKVTILGQKLYLATRFSRLVNKTKLADDVVLEYVNRSISTSNKEYLIVESTFGNGFIKAEQNQIAIGYVQVVNNSNELIILELQSGNHVLSTKYANATAEELEAAFKSLRLNGAGSLWKSFLDDAFTLQKRAEVISQNLPAQFPNLTIDELTAIKVYTSDQMRNGSKIYQTLNTELRAGNLSDYNKGLNELLNNGLNKLPQHNSNVFRGVHGQEATIAKTWNVGDDIPFKDFKSSSINRQTAAYEFSYNKGENVVYEIIGGKGSNVCGISCIPNEMEVMLKSGQKFRVKEIKPNFNIPDPLDPLSNNSFRVIVLEIVN